MHPGILNIAFKSLLHYRRSVFQQFILIALLASVITGSLMTGYSVKQSLRSSVGEKLGRTGYVISSGLRYFRPSLSDRFSRTYGIGSTPVISIDGFIQNFSSGQRSYKTKIYGIDKGFFTFHGFNTEPLKQGEVAINSNLANRLGIKAGDDIIITMTPPDDIPAGSPFASSASSGNSKVYKVQNIPDALHGGNFSTGISQMTPDNVFISLDDPLFGAKANTILIENKSGLTEKNLLDNLQKILSAGDIGLTVRPVVKTGEYEIISSRIFIDQNLVENLESVIPGSYPVIAYLANSITHNNRSTPYSFMAAISTGEIPEGDNIVVNEWLAKDIDAKAGDTVVISWYAPVRKGELAERSGKFVINRIARSAGIWADSLLMPEFPGIAGSRSCSEWNAGVEIKTDIIRKKDEDYWNRYRGMPKAFLSYARGKEIWGNNFGPATAVRFTSSLSLAQAGNILNGRINPSSSGFSSRSIYDEMLKAADNGVDFGTLFIGLGFFIIVSCILVLLLAVSTWFDSRKSQIATFRSLGFRDRWIRRLLYTETGSIALTGALAGALAGIFINNIMIHSLNSVWRGAVQTNNLSAFYDIMPFITGVAVTLFMTLAALFLRINRFLKKQVKESVSPPSATPRTMSKYIAGSMILISAALLTVNFISHTKAVYISFIAGAFLFITLIMIWRYIATGELSSRGTGISRRRILSGSFYSFHPDKAIMPVLLIAAGLFAIVITGVNRQKITGQSLSNSGGSGGYAFWAETSVPVKEDLNTISGRKIHGLEDISRSEVSFIQGRRVSGDDASCLNLNFVATPPLLGIDPSDFKRNKAFSFSSLSEKVSESDPWSILTTRPSESTIYGFADQTVLEWGLKKKVGDTLRFRAESGKQLDIIIAGGLKPSLFQGYLLIGEDNLNLFYPSVSGYSIFLVRESGQQKDSIPAILSDRFENYGITVMKASDRLASFFTVTNTYLSVFTILGLFGMMLGVIGLGFVLHRNYTSRRREFALMISSGFRITEIRRFILQEQILMMAAGILTGILSGLVSTSSSVNNIGEIPWLSILIIALAIGAAGALSLIISIAGIRQESLVSALRKE